MRTPKLESPQLRVGNVCDENIACSGKLASA